MWLGILTAIYVLGLVFIWGFFIIARVHLYKFKQYSTHIVRATKLVFLILATLTVIGFLVLIKEYSSTPKTTQTVKQTSTTETY